MRRARFKPIHGKTYKIGEVAAMLGLETYVLRFWEGEFPQLTPIRAPSGQRRYTDDHVALLRTIQQLLHSEGMTIEGARRRLAAGAHGPAGSETPPPPADAGDGPDARPRSCEGETADRLQALLDAAVSELTAMRELLTRNASPPHDGASSKE